MTEPTDLEVLTTVIEQSLSERYGTMVGSRDIWRELGYRSPSAYRQALARGTLDLPVFVVAGRRGKFALAQDIALWIARQKLS